MTNRPKNIGTAAETAVVRAVRTRGFPTADRLTLTGAHDRGDIGLCPGVILEVKAGQAAKTASDAQIAAWLVETARERINACAEVGLLVTARAGIGAGNAQRWWAHMSLYQVEQLIALAPASPDALADLPVRMPLHAALLILRRAGYGDPITLTETS